MARILERHDRHTQKMFVIHECKNCGSKIEFSRENDIGTYFNGFKAVCCPVCDDKIPAGEIFRDVE